MELFTLIVLPCVTLAETFMHNGQAITNVDQLPAIGTGVDTVRLESNNLGASNPGIPADYFQGLPLLHTIKLYDNNLDDQDVPDFCFSGVGDSLIELSLGDNLLTEIRTDQFKGLHVLEKLYLQANDIHTIQLGKPSSMRNVVRKQNIIQ